MLLRLHLNNIMLPNCWKRCIKYWILCIYSIWEKKISWNKTWDKLLENNPISSEHWIFCNIGRTGELGKHEMCTLLPSVWFFSVCALLPLTYPWVWCQMRITKKLCVCLWLPNFGQDRKFENNVHCNLQLYS